MRLFPVLSGLDYDYRKRVQDMKAAGHYMVVVAIPWAMLEPHTARIKSNHGQQTLERLAERGGLAPLEILWALDDVGWRGYERSPMAAMQELVARVLKFQATQES